MWVQGLGFAVELTQTLRKRWPIKLSRKSTRKMTNRILAIPADAMAMPEKPKIAAMIAMIKKAMAQRNIKPSL
jgi:hypothetical protein